MAISISGVGSGLPVNDWINALVQADSIPLNNYETEKSELKTAQTTLKTVKSKFTSLRSAVEKITDANLSPAFDLFDKRSVSSSDKTAVAALVNTKAVAQNINVKVENLATSTKAESLTSIAKNSEGSEKITSLGNGQGTTGTFSFYVDGEKHEFEIEKNDTLNDVLDKINEKTTDTGVSTELTDGKLKLSSANTSNFVLGSSSDTSNFLNITHLSTAKITEDDSYSSEYNISSLDTSGKVLSTANLADGITAGNFTIGNANFTINENTVLSDLVGEINSNEDAGVIASIDLLNNKLNLVAKDAGQVAINLQEGDDNNETDNSNFLTKMGLITEEGDSLSAQTLGTNSKFYLNGSANTIEATSNVVTGDITGLTGVTLKLKAVTPDDEDPIEIKIEQDTDALTSAVNSLISKVNDVITEIDSTTDFEGDLSGEYSLKSFRNTMKMTMSNRVDSLDEYTTTAQIGISTGEVGLSKNADISKYSLDTEKFLEALAANPDDVRALLIGDKEKGVTGILEQLEERVESMLDPVNGYFASRNETYITMIQDVDDSITKTKERIENQRKIYELKFASMDRAISEMQSQSAFSTMYGI